MYNARKCARQTCKCCIMHQRITDYGSRYESPWKCENAATGQTHQLWACMKKMTPHKHKSPNPFYIFASTNKLHISSLCRYLQGCRSADSQEERQTTWQQWVRWTSGLKEEAERSEADLCRTSPFIQAVREGQSRVPNPFQCHRVYLGGTKCKFNFAPAEEWHWGVVCVWSPW